MSCIRRKRGFNPCGLSAREVGCFAFIAMLLCSSDGLGLLAASPTSSSPSSSPSSVGVTAEDPVLEQVRFLLYGRERQEVAEVELKGEEFEIHLFNDNLAARYSVRIPRQDLLESNPLPASRTAEILKRRADLVAAREVVRAERRRARIARRNSTSPSGEGTLSGGRRTSTDTSSTQHGSSSLSRPIPAKSDARQGVEILKGYRQVAEELLLRAGRLGTINSECQLKIKSWNRASQQGSILSSRLREETFHLADEGETVTKRIESRVKEIDRSLKGVDDGSLRSRDVAEVADRIRRRLLQCEQKVDSIEAQLLACSDGILDLGDPVVVVAEVETEARDSRPSRATSSDDSRGLVPTSSILQPELPRSTSSRDDEPLRKPATREVATAGEVNSEQGETSDRSATKPLKSVETDQTGSTSADDSAEEDDGEQTRLLILGGILGALACLGVVEILKRVLPR